MKMRERSRKVQTVNRHHHFFDYLFIFVLPFFFFLWRASSFYIKKKKNKYLTLLIFEKSACNIAIRNFFPTCSFILFCSTSLLNRTCLSDWRWACLERGRHLLSFISTKLRWKLFTCKLCSDFYFIQTWDDYYIFSSSSFRFSPFPFFSYLFHLYLFYEVILLLILKTKYEEKNLTTLLKVWNIDGISKLGFFFWENINYVLNRKYCINNKDRSKFLLFKCMICGVYLYFSIITIYIHKRT